MRPPYEKNGKSVVLDYFVNAPMNSVLQTLTDSRKRKEFTEGVLEIRLEEQDKIERVGSGHQCITKKETINFETLDIKFSDGKVEFAEKNDSNSILPYTVAVYQLEEQPEGTKVNLELYYQLPVLISWAIDGFVRKKIKRMTLQGIEAVKEYLEPSVEQETQLKPELR